MKSSIAWKSIRYLLIGGFATGLYLVGTYVFTEYLSIYYAYSSAIAFTISTSTAFFAHKYITFNNRENKHVQQFVTFVIIALSGLAINVFGITFLVEKLGLWYITGAIITSGIVFVWNFLLNNFITFKSNSDNLTSNRGPSSKI